MNPLHQTLLFLCGCEHTSVQLEHPQQRPASS